MTRNNFKLFHYSAFIPGLLLIFPFILLNFVLVFEFEPILSVLNSLSALTSYMFAPIVLLLLFPIGSIIMNYPSIKDKKLYIINFAVGLILIVISILILSTFAEEFYRCEVLRIPNCD